MLSRRRFLGGVPLCLVAAGPRPIQIYAAMTFRPALERVLSAFRDVGGSAVGVYAPTPVLIRQLAGGAPADILLTADPGWMDQAVRQSLVQPATRSDLLSNQLVLAIPAGGPTVGTITRGFPLVALLAHGRLAMCDPEHDPAGRYGKQSLQWLGFWPRVKPMLAIAESSQAAVVLVDQREAEAAICFKTDLHGDRRTVAAGVFPQKSHAPIIHPVALGRSAFGSAASEALAFLRSAASMGVFREFGYVPAT